MNLKRLLLSGIIPSLLGAQPVVKSVLLDPCDTIGAWSAFAAAGVTTMERADAGIHGGALRWDINFRKGSGYGGVFRTFDHPLPADYELSFWMKATVPVNNLEIKFSSDSVGEHIWWVNWKNYAYPSEWKRVVVKKRHITFAWGPRQDAVLDRLRRLEIVVTAGSGGSGSVWIDDVALREIPPLPTPLPKPIVTASSVAGPSSRPERILPGSPGAWASKSGGPDWIQIDYGYAMEIGAVRAVWDNRLRDLNYHVLGSLDGRSFDTLARVRDAKAGRALLFTREAEIRFLKLDLPPRRDNSPYRLISLETVPVESVASRNMYVERLAADAPRGWYPRGFLKEQSYWTLVGVPADSREALLSEDGALEVGKERFTIEPFIRLDDDSLILSWANAEIQQSLLNGVLPIPTVTRIHEPVTLSITAVAIGEPEQSAVMTRYVLRNTTTRIVRGCLALAIRPFQVNPMTQWLNTEGGTALVRNVAIGLNTARIDDRTVYVSGKASRSGAVGIDGGEIIHHIAAGRLPDRHAISDPSAMASAAFSYEFRLSPSDSIVVIAAIPFDGEGDRWRSSLPHVEEYDRMVKETAGMWERKLGGFCVSGPPLLDSLAAMIRSTTAYILINKDGPAIQPGSRAYERSWIRDGSMTSAALLKLRLPEESRRFVEWYANYQYENGMVPCVVDKRGPDPVPENDSHGQLIYACVEYFRFTKDTAFLRARWPNIRNAVSYIQALRAQRKTEDYRSGPKSLFYGLLPESISHEGYSSKPMHSYWDDLFGLKGLKDAAYAARVLGDAVAADSLEVMLGDFRGDVYGSMLRSMTEHEIDYIPGCAELGDFDATSTSIGLLPCGEKDQMPQPALSRTFDRFYEWFVDRKRGAIEWDVYTPYEFRNAGAYVFLGQPERAHELLRWYLTHRRPSAWNQWAEVVVREERRPWFIGDMPHTWVGSDFVNAVRSMIVYERDEDSSLVLGAGLTKEWLREGVRAEDLPTHYGVVGYSMRQDEHGGIAISLRGSVDLERTNVLVPAAVFCPGQIAVLVNGTRVDLASGWLRIKEAETVIRCNVD